MDLKSQRTSITSNKSLGLSPSDLNNRPTIAKVLNKKSVNKRKSHKQSAFEDTHEDKDATANTLCKEIIDTALDIIYENELDKEVIHFVSQCSRLAWTELVKWNFQKRDKGGFVQDKTAELDTEPEPSEKDNWAAHSIPVISKTDEQTSTSSLEESKKSLKEPTDDSFPNVELEASRSMKEIVRSVMSKLKTVGHFTHLQKQFMRPKIEEVPPQGPQHPPRTSKVVEMRKESYELPSPVPVQPKHFPPSRVHLQYTITPSTRGMVSIKPPGTKTIHLDKPALPNT